MEVEALVYVLGILAVVVLAVLFKRPEKEPEQLAAVRSSGATLAPGGLVRGSDAHPVITIPSWECVIAMDATCARGGHDTHDPDNAPGEDVNSMRFWYCANYTLGNQPINATEALRLRNKRLNEINRGWA